MWIYNKYLKVVILKGFLKKHYDYVSIYNMELCIYVCLVGW